MSSVQKDDSKQQLRRMCKDIAEEITKGTREIPEGESPASEYMENVYDIEWITHQDKSYKAARLLVAGGGPNIWVNLQTNTVQGYWWGDYYEHHFTDNIGLDDYLAELHSC
mgnify:CR=1 FL=1